MLHRHEIKYIKRKRVEKKPLAHHYAASMERGTLIISKNAPFRLTIEEFLNEPTKVRIRGSWEGEWMFY